MAMNTKICSKCGNTFPAIKQYFYKSGVNGFRSECKECYKRYSSKHYKEKTNEIKQRSKEYYAKNSEIVKSKHIEYNLQNIEIIRKRNNEYYAKNSSLIRRKRIERYKPQEAHLYYLTNRLKILEHNKNYRKTDAGRECSIRKSHKRRGAIQKSGGSYSSEQWNECLRFFNNKCAYTGLPFDSNSVNVDHIIAISKGGTNNIWNVAPSLESINKSKSNKTLEEWYRKQPFFSESRLKKIYNWIGLSKSLHR